MADLLTHFASARLSGAFVRDRRLQALLVAGTFLPDLAAKGLYYVARSGADFDVPAHSFAGLLVLTYGLSLLLEERLRPGGFAALLGGAWLHLAIDLAKDHNGVGLVGLLHPFSPAGFELGWIDPENVVLLLPINAAILVAAWLLERRLRARGPAARPEPARRRPVDGGFGWKLAGALALVLALGALAAAGGASVKPAAWACLAQPARWDGQEVWIPGARVLEADPDGFLLEADELPFRVVGRAAVRPGDTVGVAGVFEASGPHLRLREWRKAVTSPWPRRIMEAVSVAVLAIVLLNFLRHFAFRPEMARLEGQSNG